MSVDEVMASILHLKHNMDEEATVPGAPAPDTSPSPICAFVAAGCGSHRDRGNNPRGPRGGRGLPNKCNGRLSDVIAEDSGGLPTLEGYIDENDDTEVSVSFSSVVFSSSLTPGRDLSQSSVVDSACSINLTAFRSDFATFTPPPPLPLAWVGSASTLRAVAHCEFLFGWHLAISFTARSMPCTPPTCHFALLIASEGSLVSIGCNPTAAVDFFPY
jgi:hypothetical protein